VSKADTLRVRDVRDAYRLIGDCRDVGSHPALWYRRMLEGLYVMFGVLQAAGGEGWWPERHHPMEPISAYCVSGKRAADDAFRAYHRHNEAGADPIYLAIGRLPGRLVTRTRRQLVPDADWHESAAFHYRWMGGIYHTLTSVFHVTDDGAISGIALNREIGDRDFSERERRLLEFFHAEVGRLIGGPLVSATEPEVVELSPRLRQTLACLLEGDSEKQVAGRLSLSQPTVHQYVTMLYRRFKVRSRAQLIARVLQRAPRLREERREDPARGLEPSLASGLSPTLAGRSA
jgi:DNA-binding CsgD family transcriptional regulator